MGLTEALHVPSSGSRSRFDPATGRLIGSVCRPCGAVSWPGRAVCHQCGAAPMEEKAFAPSGSLLTYTTVWVGRPGLEPPYTLGQVKLDDGPLVFAHVRGLNEDDVVPLPVWLVVSHEERALPPFWFDAERDPVMSGKEEAP
jgi:uncharacterized protein